MEHYTKTLPYELELTSRVLHEATRCFFELQKFPISQEEFIILDCLYINPNIIQMEIAKLILKGRAHTGKFLKSLEEKKLIYTPSTSGKYVTNDINVINSYKKKYLKNLYGDRIVTFMKETHRNTEEGIIDAFVEMNILSRTKKIYAGDSSFARISANISGINYIQLDLRLLKNE